MESECNYNQPERTSIESWKKYVSDCLVPVYEKLKLLQKVGEYLEQNTLNRSLDKIDPQLLPYFLGGVDENGNYMKGSLAELIRYMYGEEVDTKKLVNSIKMGLKNPYSEVYVKELSKYSDSFTNVLNVTLKQLELLFHKANVSVTSPSSAEIESTARNVDKFIQIVNDYIYRAKLILPMYNYYSFLIVTTRHIPTLIFADSYPEELIKSRELSYDFLGIGVYPIPLISDKEQSIKLGLTTHIPGSVSDIIFKIINNNLFMIDRLYNVIVNGEHGWGVGYFGEEYYQFMTDVLRKSSIVVNNSLRYDHMEICYYPDLSVRVCYASAESYCKGGLIYSTILDMYNDPRIISMLFMNGYRNIKFNECIYLDGMFGTWVILN